jgi:hypothetical protein
MLWTVLLGLYVATATLAIVHEIDSAYWREWELFGLPGGGSAFVLLHLPIVALVMYGAVAVERQTTAGLALALVVAAGALGAGGIHTRFLRAGHPQFRTAASIAVLAAGVVAGLALAICAIAELFAA